ncbi:MAG TPA: flagellar hook-basal body complex protein [Bacillota bacterium]|nr:flagellar hook-basal body complex protein [Bacillota bacterium]
MVSGMTSGEEISPPAMTKGIQDSYIDFSEGFLLETGAKFDLAIEGEGFFVVSTPHSTLYTRNGQFTVNDEKKLVTMSGYPVQGSEGEITIAGTQVFVAPDGSVTVDGKPVVRLKVVDFEEKEAIRPIGNSLYFNTREDNEETASAGYSIRQGFIESSNVNVMNELTNLINCIRAYEAFDKVKQKISEATGKINELPRFKA